MARPLGVTILAILYTLWGIWSLVSAVSLVAILGAIGLYSPFYGAFGWIIVAVYAVSTILGILGFMIAYGFWNGRSWAWILSIITAIIGIMLGLVGFFISSFTGFFNIIIQAIVIYYLTRPHVKEFFGKGVFVPPPPSLIPPSSNRYPTIRCPNCGYNNQTNFSYCGKCGAPLTEEETKIY